MYKVKIEQGYSTVEFEFQTARETDELIEWLSKNCSQTTTFKMEYFKKVFVEEGGEANES